MSGPQTFTVKQLRFTFTLANNAVFNGVNNTLQITGLRSLVDLDFPTPPAYPTATGRVYGMTQSDMAALTALTQAVLTTERNSVQIEANSGSGWSTVFSGQLITTLPDFTDVPNVSLRFYGMSLGYDSVNPAQPTSYPTGADVATVASAICQKLSPSCTLINSGVEQTFSGAVYFPGTARDQLTAVCKKAGIAYYCDQAGIVEITPSGSPRNKPLFVLSPTTGLKGYPGLDDVNLISAECVFNPALVYGGQVQIKDALPTQANGTWQIVNIKHSISEQFPDGPWFSAFRAQPPAGYKFGQ